MFTCNWVSAIYFRVDPQCRKRTCKSTWFLSASQLIIKFILHHLIAHVFLSPNRMLEGMYYRKFWCMQLENLWVYLFTLYAVVRSFAWVSGSAECDASAAAAEMLESDGGFTFRRKWKFWNAKAFFRLLEWD